MKIVYWGTYDLGKPRVRILLRGMRENRIEVTECHRAVWQGVEDKSRISGWLGKARFLLSWLFAYPGLIFRYLRLPPHDAVVVGYLGQLDVLVLWPFARLRGVPLVWDAFISLYDTVVCDRRLVSRHHPLALLIYGWEWLACQAAQRVILDTRAHADFFRELYGLSAEKLQVALVGAEPEIFAEVARGDTPDEREEPFMVLFYGQFIPLHGIETIVSAARQLQAEPIRFVIIGQGQEEQRIREILTRQPLQNLQWIPWVEYPDLIEWIGRADVCLGIFGETAKASRVIPNKVFQVVAAGKPLITRESPAIRELFAFASTTDPVTLVKAGDPSELAARIKKMSRLPQGERGSYSPAVRAMIQPEAIGRQMKNILEDVVASSK